MGHLREKFLKDGYLKIDNVFDPKLLDQLISGEDEINTYKDLSCYKSLWKIMINEKVLSILKDVFDNDLNYNFDSNFLMNAETNVPPKDLCIETIKVSTTLMNHLKWQGAEYI